MTNLMGYRAESIRSRQKHLHSKRLASSSPAALAEILGVPVSSLTPSASPSPAPLEIAEVSNGPSGASTPQDPARTAEETISTSNLSVSDYFRQKLREKMLARQSASGSSTPDMPEGSLARVKEEVKVAVGGVEWEGSRTTFGEVKEEEDVKPDIKPTLPIEAKVELVDDKEAKRLAKEERRRQKDEKRKRKEEKRARKAGSEPVVKVEQEAAVPAVVDVIVADGEVDEKLKKRKRDDRDRPRKQKKGKETV